MVYKRYIYKNGKKFGPYYYHNKKVDGKVISNYVGTTDPTHKLPFSKFIKSNSKFIIFFLSIISIILLVNFIFNLKLFSTGNPIEDSLENETFQKNISPEDLTEPKNETSFTQQIPETNEVVPILTLVQNPAIINEPVQWTQKIKLQQNGEVKVEIPKYAQDIIVYKINEAGEREVVSSSKITITAKASSDIISDNGESQIISFFKKIFSFITGKAVDIKESEENKLVTITEDSQEYEIEYKTPAPSVREEQTSDGKKIIVSSEIHYEDVLVFTSLKEFKITDAEKIVLYWNEKKEEIPLEKIEDQNSDGIYDRVEWIVPELINETFEIIVITQAKHLDINRNFLADIYNEVYELDDVWSEKVSFGEYVRVTFEEKLTSENDITIYPKVIDGNPRIEVYEKDSDSLLAEFSEINSEGYNQIFLENLVEEQDTFDLKIVDGSVEFDHIIDPTFITGNEAHDVSVAILDSSIGLFVEAWCDDTSDAAYYQIFYTNGTAYNSRQTINSAAGDSCRIGVSALDSNSFVIAYVDWTSSSSDWIILGKSITGSTIFGPRTIDSDMNANVDVDVCALDSTHYVSVAIDDTDDDATFVIYNLGNPVIGQTDVDSNVVPDTGARDQNTLSCATLSSNLWVLTYFDDNPDNIIYELFDSSGVAVTPPTTVSTSATDGAVSITRLANGNFAIAYCDSTDDDISFQIYNSAGNVVVTETDVDTAVTGCGAASGTHVAVTALNTSDSQFVVAYDDTNVDRVYFSVYNSAGTQILSPQMISTSDTIEKTVTLSGFDSLISKLLCQYTDLPVFLIAYNNPTDAVWNLYYSNGTAWDGVCQAPITNSPPAITSVGPLPLVGPLEGTTRPVVFNVRVSDQDGYADISDVKANFTFYSEPVRKGRCVFQNNVDATTAIYSCTIDMFYYDAAGNWNVFVEATDSQGAFDTDNSATFTYQTLMAMVIISPTESLGWPTLNPGSINIPSSNDPIIINNTGNFEGPIYVTSRDLAGDFNPAEFIHAQNFAAGPASGSECSATQLQDSTIIRITGSNLARGQTATEEVYFCITQIPPVSSQSYSATGANAWIISV